MLSVIETILFLPFQFDFWGCYLQNYGKHKPLTYAGLPPLHPGGKALDFLPHFSERDINCRFVLYSQHFVLIYDFYYNYIKIFVMKTKNYQKYSSDLIKMIFTLYFINTVYYTY